MSYKQKGWSPFTRKTDPVKKPAGPVTPSTQAEYGKRQVWNLIERQNSKDGQDRIESNQKQIENLRNDIKLLQKRNKPGDDKRIKILKAELTNVLNKK